MLNVVEKLALHKLWDLLLWLLLIVFISYFVAKIHKKTEINSKIFIFVTWKQLNTHFMVEVYVEKFGGASVNSASAVRNVISILQREEKIRIVVISAMGKTTNSLEKIVDLWHRYNKFNEEEFLLSKNYHKSIIQDLFENNSCIDIALNMLEKTFEELKQVLFGLNPNDYDFLYDKIVSYGERLSTGIISLYMTSLDLNHRLVPAQELIKTDNSYRGAQVDWKQTEKAVKEKFKILFTLF